jgi:L-aminopeptidase/D-esterase-like protein
VITDVPGVGVGHWTGSGTGVTVVTVPPMTTASGEVRGGAPASRELALLEPERLVEHVDAVVLTGGSAFGLATADGVMRALEEQGRGFSTAGGPVPIVPAAAVYDLVESGGVRPGPEEGASAFAAARVGEPFATGRVGAGTGATVGKWKGAEHLAPGGLGTASRRVGAATVGVLAVVNAIGDVIGADGAVVAGSAAPPDTPGFPDPLPFVEGEHTTLVVLATDARLTKAECHLVAHSAHGGFSRALFPSHTRFDGDLAVVLATGAVDGHLDRIRAAVLDLVPEAIRAAVA